MAVTSPRAASFGTPTAPLQWANAVEHRRMLAVAINALFDGKVRSTGSVTLTANDTTTTLNETRINPNSVILLMPTTANAAGAVATTYVSARGDKTATITHANNAQTDKTFAFVVLG